MRFRYQVGQQAVSIAIDRQDDRYRAVIDGVIYEAEVLDSQPGKLTVSLGGRPAILYWAADGGNKWISMQGCTYLLEKPADPSARRSGSQSSEGILRAPMPALVRAVLAFAGDEVEKGQPLLLLEAMKMEIRLTAPIQGRIVRLEVAEGQTVERYAMLLEIQ